MALIQTIYVSTADPALTDADVVAILDCANRHNARHGISGMLLLVDGCFMQVLEGPEDAVDPLMLRISSDARHRKVMTLERLPIRVRDFPRWSMGFRRMHAVDVPPGSPWEPLFVGWFRAEKIGARPGAALDLLQEFARGNSGL